MCLAPDVTELAFALGAGPRVLAVSPHSDYPEQARLAPVISPTDPEAILAKRPDLVLATTAGNDPRLIDQLARLGVTVCTLDVTSCVRLADGCELVATVLGTAEGGLGLARDIRQRCAALQARGAALPARGALYVVWWDPLIAAGPGTFHDDALRLAGLVNLAPPSNARYPRLDREILLDPRLEIVVTAEEGDVRATFAEVLRQPHGSRLRSGSLAVIWLPADAISRPGPRLPSAIEALVAAREASP